ncbi:MAG: hypothetical protein WC083_04160 [Candidatus Methanomethylophilaceae archaeon]
MSMEVERNGLPFKPGQKLPEDVASGLIGDGDPQEPVLPEDANRIIEEEKNRLLKDASLKKAELEPDSEKAQEQSPVESDEEAAANKSEVTCEVCGHKVGKKPQFEPTPQDMEDFFRAACFPDDSRFIKKYEIWGGKVVAWFRSRKPCEDDMLQEQLRKAFSWHMNDEKAIHLLCTKWCMAASLMRLEFKAGHKSKTIDYPEVTPDTYPPVSSDKFDAMETYMKIEMATPMGRAYRKIVSGMNSALSSALYSRYGEFLAITNILTAKSGNPDFTLATPPQQ